MRTRSERVRRYLEIAANLAIVIVAIIIIFTLIRSRWQTKPELEGPQVGTKIALSGMKWDDRATLVLALQQGCRYCDESAPFYRRLHDLRVASAPRMLAVVPGDKDEVAQYLSKMGVRVDEVLNRSLADIKVTATPTLLLVNSSGKVTDVWVGKLNSLREEQVVQRMLALR